MPNVAPFPPVNLAVGDAPSRSVVSQADLTYLGRFALPLNAGTAGQSQYFNAMTIRNVGGATRAIVAIGHLQEWAIPTPSTAASPPLATLLQDYGTFPAWFKDQNGATYTPAIYGLHFDRISDRLYVSFGNDYNTSLPNNPSLLSCALGAGALVDPAGPWLVSGLGCKATQGGCLEIPDDFAQTYTAGKRLGLGFGGYFSVLSAGGVSMGPSLHAIDPPTAPALTAVLKTTLSYFNANAAPRFIREPVTPPFVNGFDAASPDLWSWEPIIGAAWIQTPTKHGVLFSAHVAAGAGDYVSSYLRFESGAHRWYVLDPADLAAAAQGTKSADSLRAAAFWDTHYPDVDYTQFPMTADTPKAVVSLTSSGTTATVVTASPHGYPNGQGILIKGATPAAYNIMSTLTVVNPTTFTYWGLPSAQPPASGSITVQRVQQFYPVPFGSARKNAVCWDVAGQRLYVGVTAKFPGQSQPQMVIYVWSVQ